MHNNFKFIANVSVKLFHLNSCQLKKYYCDLDYIMMLSNIFIGTNV